MQYFQYCNQLHLKKKRLFSYESLPILSECWPLFSTQLQTMSEVPQPLLVISCGAETTSCRKTAFS